MNSYSRFLFPGLMILLVACNNGSTPEDKKAHDSLVTEDPTVEITPISPQTKPEEGQYCRIQNLYTANDSSFIDAQYIRFLMGADAGKAANAEGDAQIMVDENGDTSYVAPNGYYIVDMVGTHTLPLASNVEILLNSLKNSDSSEEAKKQLNKELADGIFILTIQQGIVTRIKEQFIP